MRLYIIIKFQSIYVAQTVNNNNKIRRKYYGIGLGKRRVAGAF